MERPTFVTRHHLGVLSRLDAVTTQDMIRAIPEILACVPEWNAYQAQLALQYMLDRPAGGRVN